MPKLKRLVDKIYRTKGFLYRPVFLVVFLALTVLLFVFALVADKKIRDAALNTQTRDLSQLVSFQQENLVSQTKLFLAALSLNPRIKALAPPDCSEFLSKVLDKDGFYNNVVVNNLKGDVICSAVETSSRLNSSDREFFRKVVETKKFAAGDYVVGRITNKPTIISVIQSSMMEEG